MARCSICHTLLQPDEEKVSCPDCQQDYHQGCWKDLGGCATYGCKKAAVADKPPPPVLVGAGWGDVKVCPQCSLTIASSLLLCRCGARFPYADPMTPTDYQAYVSKQRAVSTSKAILLILFFVSIIGVTAPITGTIAGIYSYLKREQLSGANGTYLALGWGSAALGATYAVVMVFLGFGY
jgi:hypothetical protein